MLMLILYRCGEGGKEVAGTVSPFMGWQRVLRRRWLRFDNFGFPRLFFEFGSNNMFSKYRHDKFRTSMWIVNLPKRN